MIHFNSNKQLSFLDLFNNLKYREFYTNDDYVDFCQQRNLKANDQEDGEDLSEFESNADDKSKDPTNNKKNRKKGHLNQEAFQNFKTTAMLGPVAQQLKLVPTKFRQVV